MPEEPYVDLDVRPLISAQAPPLGAILDAARRLTPGQALRVTAPFEPVPLYAVLGRQGFAHQASREPDGSWVIVFRRG